jgi:hypothetical protein
MFVVILVIAVASRPVEVRLWRAGRITDRTLTLLMLGRFPVLVALLAVLGGMSPGFTAVLVGLTALPGLLLYRWFLGLVREQARP